MRHLLLAAWLVVLIAALSLTWRARSVSPDMERDTPDTYAGAAPLPDLLYRRIDRVDFDNVPLEDAIHALIDPLHASYVIYWFDVAQSALPHDSKITVHLRNVTVGGALQAVCDAASYGEIKIGETDGILTIAGDTIFYENEIQVYDIRDLLQDDVQYDRQTGECSSGSPQSDPYRRALLAYIREIQKQTGFAVEEAQDAQSTRSIFSSVSDPRDTDGLFRNVWYGELAGRLIITAPRPMQNRIRDLLDQFRLHTHHNVPGGGQP